MKALTILLIEDDAIDREVVHRMFPDASAEITTVGKLSEARLLLATVRPDCVLLDWALPDGRAPELVSWMLAEDIQVPVVLLLSGSLEVERAQALGCDHLIKGAFQASELLRAVGYAIERFHAALFATRVGRVEGLASVGQLAAGITRQVDDPATFALANLEHLRSITQDEPARQVIDQCEVGIRQIALVMHRLGQLSQRSTPRATWTRLDEVAQGALKRVESMVGTELMLEVDTESVPSIAADRESLQAVVLHLLENAQQAIEAKEPNEVARIRLRVRRGSNHVTLVVEDSGIGLPAGCEARVFEPFFSRGRGRVGLGLTVCQEIVASLGGSVSAGPSTLGGAAFRVTLPLVTGLAVEPLKTGARQGATLSILLVDTAPLEREALGRMLAGHTLRVANFEETAALAEQLQPDVIVCGSELGKAAALLRTLQARGPKLVRLIGAADPTPEFGIPLRKPFSADDLQQAVADSLAAQREQP